IAEGLRAGGDQARPFGFVTVQALAKLDECSEQKRALLVAQPGLDDQAAQLDLLARILLASVGCGFPLHSLKPRQRRPQPRQMRPAWSMWRRFRFLRPFSLRRQRPSLRETASPDSRTRPEDPPRRSRSRPGPPSARSARCAR